MSSSDYESIKKNVIQHKVWWRGDNSIMANDEIEQLSIKEGDIVLFFDTFNKEFCLIAEVAAIPMRANQLESFIELKNSIQITPDRLVIPFKDNLQKISFVVTEENFGVLKNLGLFGNTRSFKTLGRYLQSKARGRLTSLETQEEEAFQYIYKDAREKYNLMKCAENDNTINIDEDWQKFNSAINEFSEKFRKHPHDYVYLEEKALQYLFFDVLIEKFGDWYEIVGDKYKLHVEIPNRHDISIYTNREDDDHISIACEIKLIRGDDINNLIDSMKATKNSVLADIQKLQNSVQGKVDSVNIKSGVALIFTNINILDERLKLEDAINQFGGINSDVKLVIVGADGTLTFDKN